MPTDFAPAERRSAAEIQRQTKLLAGATPIPAILDSMINIVLILNTERQIVFASKNASKLFGDEEEPSAFLGRRPGEALGCMHSAETPGGCGTTVFCSQCGAVRAILAGLSGHAEEQECRMLRTVNGHTEAIDLRVQGTPFPYRGEQFCVFAIADISHEKRRHALERIFFHDILNYAGGLQGLTALMNENASAEIRSDMDILVAAVNGLTEEILWQRDLTAAEHNEIKPTFQVIDSIDLIQVLVQLYQRHDAASGQHLRIAADSARLRIFTDPSLLRRVLGNLIKNALEAAPRGSMVTISVKSNGDRAEFGVQNPGVMPAEVQLQIFQRSFSTKGSARGLGTYSVKLLTERYLHGHVDFASDESSGTRFTITLPLKEPVAPWPSTHNPPFA